MQSCVLHAEKELMLDINSVWVKATALISRILNKYILCLCNVTLQAVLFISAYVPFLCPVPSLLQYLEPLQTLHQN